MPKRLSGLGISIAVLLIIMGFSTFYFEGIKTGYKEQILRENRHFNTSDSRKVERYKGFINNLSEDQQPRVRKVLGLSDNPVEFINLTRRIREGFYQKEYFINFQIQFSHTAADFLRKLSMIVSDEIKLSNLSIKLDKMSLDFYLNGVISEEGRLQEQFMAFYNKIEDFDNILEINLSRRKVNLNQVNPGTNRLEVKKPGVKNRQQLFFSIRGKLELE